RVTRSAAIVRTREHVLHVLLAAIVSAWILNACSAGAKQPDSGGKMLKALGLTHREAGMLIVTSSDGDLLEYSLGDGSGHLLVSRPVSGARLQYPSISPDGQMLAYVMQVPGAGGSSGAAGADLLIADRDGAHAR